jgi:hypothetical protein
MRALRLVGLAVTALLLLGCGGGGDAPATTTAAKPKAAKPVLCGKLRTRITGRVSAPAATELSGLALSRTQTGVLWTHNDSGDRARVLAVDSGGKLLAELAVPDAENVDWEDIAIGPAAGGGDALYIADIGDNLAKRASVVVYRVPEPRVAGGAAPIETASAQRLGLRYPDGARDAEALLVDPSTGALVIVSKDFGGTARVYVAKRPAAGATTTLRPTGTLSLGIGEAVTAGDVAADGRTVALRTYDTAYLWSRRPGESITTALRRRPCSPRVRLLREGQGEALALSRHGTAFLTVPEGANPALRRYTPARS